MTETDVFQFSKLKIFDGITENLSEGAKEIIDIHEDLLFAWDLNDNNLRVSNWRSESSNKKEKNIKCQTLCPSSSQNFSVSKVLISYGGGYAAICGTQGLSIIELPARWGSDGLYSNGKSKITCGVVNIHESTTNTNQLEVIQIRWHPNSPTDSHLFVLYSNNSLKIYDEGNLKHSWQVGPSCGGRKLSFIKSLGDTAIDFDIAPAQVSVENQLPNNNNKSAYIGNLSLSNGPTNREVQKKIEWPIIILRGNGTIFVLSTMFNTEKAKLQGPLTMTPSQMDNYGDDSCSLLVIPTSPITLVIAETSGILHHVLMIDSFSANSSNLFKQTDCELYVLENIELELSLQNESSTQMREGRLMLKRDTINEHRYFCYHDAGLHGISLGFGHQLQKFINDESVEGFHASFPSRAEYILSTRAFSDAKIKNAVVGFGMFNTPSGILTLMSSGQVVSLRTLKASPQLYTLSPQIPNLEQKIIGQQNSPKISFDQHVKMLLLHSSEGSQIPILIDRQNIPSSKQAFQLLMSSIQIMRDNQFQKHDKVRQEIMKRVKILELMKSQQRDEISALLQFKKSIQENAYKVADMHEEILERQIILQKRINDVCLLASLKSPTNLSQEKEFSDQIKRLNFTVNKLSQDVNQIKAKHDNQKKSLDKWNKFGADGGNSTPFLPPKQEESIKQFIGEMMRQIQELKLDVQKVYNAID